MEILVSVTTRCGGLYSPLWTWNGQGYALKRASLLIQGPESVQSLRDSHCEGYLEPIIKWLDSMRLKGSAISPDTFERLMWDFAICVGNANTHGIIWDRDDECVELTMVFTNRPASNLFEHEAKCVRDLQSLQNLTKDLTLSKAWQD